MMDVDLGRLAKRLDTPRFRGETPRVLVLESPYFLHRELPAALERMGAPHAVLPLPDTDAAPRKYAAELLTAIATLEPDFLLTVNHFGLDAGGGVAALLERIRLPLASWFVDRPGLTLPLFETTSDWITVFCHDKDDVTECRDLGWTKTAWLPLGTDPSVFRPDAPAPKRWAEACPAGDCAVAFVGSSDTNLLGQRLRQHRYPLELVKAYKPLAAAFKDSDFRLAREFLHAHRPDLFEIFAAMPLSARLAYQSVLYRQASRLRRRDLVRALLPHAPLIVGDRWWEALVPEHGGRWKRLESVRYYDELPGLYARARVSANVTNAHMAGAVNQRVFDVPAAGGFLLTDSRAQLQRLFDPGDEVAVYDTMDDIPGLLDRALQDEAWRASVAARARRRVLAEHTYEHRLARLCQAMRRTYG